MPKPKKNDPAYKIIKINPLHLEGTPSLYFNSIITEFNDSYTPRWTPTNVYGRMDPMSNYSGTDRTLTLGFRVISDDRKEAAANMVNIQKLIQYQYPTYMPVSGVNVIAASPYFRFKFLNAVGGAREYLEGYINGAIQINPGFQSKDQAQFFSTSVNQVSTNSKLLFSDVNIVLRIQVLHEGLVGMKVTSNQFIDGKGANTSYPYGIGGTPPASAPKPPQNNTKTGDAESPLDPSADKETTDGQKGGSNVPNNEKAKRSIETKKQLEKSLSQANAKIFETVVKDSKLTMHTSGRIKKASQDLTIPPEE